jgi:hypothetical protein
MGARRRPGASPRRAPLPAAQIGRPAVIPALSPDERQRLMVAIEGGGIVPADDEPVGALAGLGLVSTVAWPGGEVRFVATPAGRLVAMALAAAPAAA